MSSYNLTKNKPYDLTKPNGAQLSRIFLGLGWDKAKPKGLFGSIFGAGGGDSIDLDASCLMFDAQGRVVDKVWFRSKTSADGTVRHSGDNLTGEGEGDDEVINVDLARLPAHVQSLVFTVNSFRGQTFATVERAKVRVVDADTGTELCRYDLSAKCDYTAQVMAKVSRKGSGWEVTALGVAANGRTVDDLVSAAQRLL